MLKQILIFCFLIGMTSLTQAQHLQLLDNRGEFGLYRGQSSYRGDIAPDIFKFNKKKSPNVCHSFIISFTCFSV